MYRDPAVAVVRPAAFGRLKKKFVPPTTVTISHPSLPRSFAFFSYPSSPKWTYLYSHCAPAGGSPDCAVAPRPSGTAVGSRPPDVLRAGNGCWASGRRHPRRPRRHPDRGRHSTPGRQQFRFRHPMSVTPWAR